MERDVFKLGVIVGMIAGVTGTLIVVVILISAFVPRF